MIYLFLYLSVYICTCLCAPHLCIYPQRSQGLGYPRNGAIGSCGPNDMDAREQNQDLCKSSTLLLTPELPLQLIGYFLKETLLGFCTKIDLIAESSSMFDLLI